MAQCTKQRCGLCSKIDKSEVSDFDGSFLSERMYSIFIAQS